MMLTIIHEAQATRRGRGRPSSSESPDQRREHLACLYRRQVVGLPLRTVAFDMRISLATAKRYIARARGYPEAETREALVDAILTDPRDLGCK